VNRGGFKAELRHRGFNGRPLRVLHGAGKREVAQRPWHGDAREGRHSAGSVKEEGRKGARGLVGRIGSLGQMAAQPGGGEKKKIEIYFESDF
jgi:hypothetical protein